LVSNLVITISTAKRKFLEEQPLTTGSGASTPLFHVLPYISFPNTLLMSLQLGMERLTAYTQQALFQ
jgi:hypothetical protein